MLSDVIVTILIANAECLRDERRDERSHSFENMSIALPSFDDKLQEQLIGALCGKKFDKPTVVTAVPGWPQLRWYKIDVSNEETFPRTAEAILAAHPELAENKGLVTVKLIEPQLERASDTDAGMWAVHTRTSEPPPEGIEIKYKFGLRWELQYTDFCEWLKTISLVLGFASCSKLAQFEGNEKGAGCKHKLLAGENVVLASGKWVFASQNLYMDFNSGTYMADVSTNPDYKAAGLHFLESLIHTFRADHPDINFEAADLWPEDVKKAGGKESRVGPHKPFDDILDGLPLDEHMAAYLTKETGCIVPSGDASPGCMVWANNFEPLVDPDS